MKLWTEPAALEMCFLCKRSDVISGYRCMECNVNLCDACTTRESRNKIRSDWDKEVKNLMGFMKKNRRQSDVAMFYQWRHANHVVSVGLLVDYVQELRTAKDQAEKQIDQKPIIDKIKEIRAEICKHAELCATAARESVTNENFVFPSRKKAARELNRLAMILKEMIQAQAPDRRLAAGVACPLGHAMDSLDCGPSLLPMWSTPHSAPTSPSPKPIPFPGSPTKKPSAMSSVATTAVVASPEVSHSKVVTLPAITEEDPSHSAAPSSSSKLHSVPSLPPTSSKEEMLLKPLKATQTEQIAALEDAMNRIAVDFPGSPFSSQHLPRCSVCDSKDLNSGGGKGGRICSICEYYLCADCSVVYCRMGHRTKIWTLHDAHHMSCDVCKKMPILSGYRCMTCQVDICDFCTTRESRNAFLLWPKRELQHVIQSLEMLRMESPTAREYLVEYKQKDDHYLHVMSKLCKVLQEAQEALHRAQEEVKKKIAVTKGHNYGTLRSREML